MLALYRFDGCPWCERVRAAIDDLELDVDERDIRKEPRHAADLRAATGRGRVPVLRIEDGAETRWLPESADIVRYLYATYGEGRRPALLASNTLQTMGAVVALALFVTALAASGPQRSYLFAGAGLVFVLRNNVPLIRLAWPRRRAAR